MTDVLNVLLEDIIDIIMRTVEDETQRAEIYEDIFQPFEEAGLEDFTQAVGFDPVFDTTFYARYPEAESEHGEG